MSPEPFDTDAFGQFLDLQERTAYHEAGHGVVAVLSRYRRVVVGFGPVFAENTPPEHAHEAGYQDNLRVGGRICDATPAELRKALCISLAGSIAERRLAGKVARLRTCLGADADRERVALLGDYLHERGGVFRCGLKARRMLRENWCAVVEVASLMLDRTDDGGIVRHNEIARAIREGKGTP